MPSSILDPDKEFSKLDELDKGLFVEILENQNSSVKMWIDHISEVYTRKGVFIDSDKFKSEVQNLPDFLNREGLNKIDQ